jgi:hypothetical protein
MIEVYQTVWAEVKYLVLAKNKMRYEEINELMKEENFSIAFKLIDEVVKSDAELDNYKEAAQEIWGHFKNKERDNSHFFATLNNQNENLRLLWGLNVQYEPVYLLNCRIFLKDSLWNKAWVIKNNRIRLFLWEEDKYFRLKLPEDLMKKVAHQTKIEEYSKKEKDLLGKALILVSVDDEVVVNPKIMFAIHSGLEIG